MSSRPSAEHGGVGSELPDRELPSVAVIIPTHNEARCITATILSARAAGATEILVVDGGSSDITVDLATAAGATVLHSESGRGTQIRSGWRSTTGEVILILHADNQLPIDGIDAIRQCVLENPNGLVWGCFHQRIDSTRIIYRCVESGNRLRVRFRGMVFGDQGMFVHRELLDRINGPPAVPLMEDALMSRRLRQIKPPILLPPSVSVDARRWQRRGVVRQTLLNWKIQFAHRCGVDENTLRRWYR